MANRYAMLGVEGPYDRFFIAELLVRHGFGSFNGELAALDKFWVNLKPAWPKNGKLYGRPEMPQIVHKSGTSVAICAGEGANLLNQFPDTFKNRPQYKTDIAAFGLVADADTEASADVAKKYAAAYRPYFPSFPNTPGVVDTSATRSGIFVLPDNTNKGTLEEILLECGTVGYPDLTTKARAFVRGIDQGALTEDDKDGLLKPAGEKKAVVSCVGSVLKPGLTLDNSIRKDRWLEAGALALPRVAALTKFLRELIVF